MSWWDDVVGDAGSSDNNKSVVARIGAYGQKYTDPLSWIFGKSYRDWLVNRADNLNGFLSRGFFKPAGKYLGQFDPIRQSSKEADQVGDWGESKPVDTLALLAAAYFGGAALAGSSAGGGSAAGGITGSAGSSGAAAGGLGGAGAGAGLEGVTVTAAPYASGMGAGFAAGLGGAASAAAGNSLGQGTQNNFDWQKLLKQMQQSQQQQQQSQSPQGAIMRKPGGGQFYYYNTPQPSLGNVGATLRPLTADNGTTQGEMKSLLDNQLLRLRLGMTQ
jgi:hypothetical protein